MDPTTISPPAELQNSPEILETTIKDLVDKDPLLLTQEDINRLVAAFRASRSQFAQLDLDKARGSAPKGQRKPKAPQISAAARLGLDDLDIDIKLDDL